MDYIKWIILEKHRAYFECGLWLPIFLLNGLLVGGTWIIFIPALAILLTTISVGVWGLILYLFSKESFDKSYAEYLNRRKK